MRSVIIGTTLLLALVKITMGGAPWRDKLVKPQILRGKEAKPVHAAQNIHTETMCMTKDNYEPNYDKTATNGLGSVLTIVHVVSIDTTNCNANVSYNPSKYNYATSVISSNFSGDFMNDMPMYS